MGARCLLQRRSLFPASRLDLDIHVDERHGRWRDAGDAARLAQRARLHAHELLFHLARQAGDSLIVEPVWNRSLLRLLQAFNRLLLLVEISRILNLGFDRAEFIEDL